MKDKMTFEEFVDWIKYSSSTCLHPSPHVNQLDWFCDGSGNILVDFIGKFERIQDDWAFVAETLNLPRQLPHKNANKVPRKHYTEYYSQKTKEIIQNKFRTDIEYFSYTFAG